MQKWKMTNEQDIFAYLTIKAPYLTPTLRQLAEYILGHPEQCKTMTIKQLATACKVAEATVTRFVKEIGLKNYQELKIGIAESVTRSGVMAPSEQEKYVYDDISRNDSISVIIDKVVYRNIQTLKETKRRLDIAQLENAVEAIENANSIVFCCMGSSSIAAEEGVMRFSRVGKKCLLFRDQSIQLITSAVVNNRDVVIGISNSGHSQLVIESLMRAQANGAKTIGITSIENSPLIKYADICLFTPTKSSPLGPGLTWEATNSKSAQTLIVDLLCTCFAVRNFDQTLKYLEETYKAVKGTRSIS